MGEICHGMLLAIARPVGAAEYHTPRQGVGISDSTTLVEPMSCQGPTGRIRTSSQFASRIALRNWRMRSFFGAPNISPGAPCSANLPS